MKQYKEIRKLTTWQGEDYTTGCLLGYEHIKNHYRLITIDLSRHAWSRSNINRIRWTIKKTR